MCVFEVWNLFGGETESWFSYRFPLPNGPGKVKLPVGQVDLNKFFLFISYYQIEEFQNSWNRASDDFEKRQAQRSDACNWFR